MLKKMDVAEIEMVVGGANTAGGQGGGNRPVDLTKKAPVPVVPPGCVSVALPLPNVSWTGGSTTSNKDSTSYPSGQSSSQHDNSSSTGAHFGVTWSPVPVTICVPW